MQISHETSNVKYQIKKYQPGCVTVNEQNFHESIIVMPDVLESWNIKSFTDISIAVLEKLLHYKPEIILIGTGNKVEFLDSQLATVIFMHKTGLEVMTTQAACRTYSILVAEQRNVLAALII